MALVDDDHVEEIRWVLPQDTEAVGRIGEGLVQREVDLATRVRSTLDLPDSVPKHRTEFARDGLIHQDVAVGEVEHPGSPSSVRPTPLPELPHDLKRHERLARPGGHREQHPLPAVNRRLDSPVDGDPLVVPGSLYRSVRTSKLAVEGNRQGGGRFVGRAAPAAVPCPELARRRERRQVALEAGVVVVLNDALSV